MSITGFSPTEFIAKSDALGGLAKTWKYGVQIIPPSGMSNSAADNIEFLAASATFPGKSFGTTEHRTYGITRTLPYEQTYEPIDIVFWNTNDFSPKRFWDDWLNLISNPNTYNMTYYKNMIGRIILSHYSDDTEVPTGAGNYSCTLFEAYPTSISTIDVGWENSEIMKFTVSIRYKNWKQGYRTGGGYHTGKGNIK